MFKRIFNWLVKKYNELGADIKIAGEQAWQEGYEIGLERARQENRDAYRRAVRDWYERQQAAFRAGIPFDEPPPGYAPQSHTNGADLC